MARPKPSSAEVVATAIAMLCGCGQEGSIEDAAKLLVALVLGFASLVFVSTVGVTLWSIRRALRAPSGHGSWFAFGCGIASCAVGVVGGCLALVIRAEGESPGAIAVWGVPAGLLFVAGAAAFAAAHRAAHRATVRSPLGHWLGIASIAACAAGAVCAVVAVTRL